MIKVCQAAITVMHCTGFGINTMLPSRPFQIMTGITATEPAKESTFQQFEYANLWSEFPIKS